MPRPNKFKLILVVGARPNFMKIAPLCWQMESLKEHIDCILVHTGQHYDARMSNVFFKDLALPKVDVNLEVGSGTHAWQTAHVLLKFEAVLRRQNPDLLIVVGDVNSTLACALAASKMGIPIAHVEAGLRSFDRTMPEEINRVLTDQLSDLLFTPSRDADRNLRREGVPSRGIHRVGNIMIDSLVRILPKTADSTIVRRLNLRRKGFILVTLHRPSNVDEGGPLSEIFRALTEIAREYKVVFPVHPRTRARIRSFLPRNSMASLSLLPPLGYTDFIALMRKATAVLTDSGGVQEETTYLGIPCLTLRPNTERPVTIREGTNRLVPLQAGRIVRSLDQAVRGNGRTPAVPDLWDGRTAPRIVSVLKQRFDITSNL